MNLNDLRKKTDAEDAVAIEKMNKMRDKLQVFYSGDEDNIDDEFFFENKNPISNYFMKLMEVVIDWLFDNGIIIEKQKSPTEVARDALIFICVLMIPITLFFALLAVMFLRVLIILYK
ncbi:MAG: hypothetical protein WCO84_02690 [bacterium]